MIHKTIEDGNGNDGLLDSARSNFLIWLSENAPAMGPCGFAAAFNAADFARRRRDRGGDPLPASQRHKSFPPLSLS